MAASLIYILVIYLQQPYSSSELGVHLVDVEVFIIPSC